MYSGSKDSVTPLSVQIEYIRLYSTESDKMSFQKKIPKHDAQNPEYYATNCTFVSFGLLSQRASSILC